MAYLELKIEDNSCRNLQKRALLMPFVINFLLIMAELFPQSSYFASNILRFGEGPEKLTKMLPEPNNSILMSECFISITRVSHQWTRKKTFHLLGSGEKQKTS